MRRIISITLALVFLALSQGVGQEHRASPDEKSENARPLSPADKDAVVQSIVDEMYVNNIQGYGFDVGKQTSASAYHPEQPRGRLGYLQTDALWGGAENV